MSSVERECFDIFSYISLLLNNDTDSIANQTENMDLITEKMESLVGMMSPEFLEVVQQNTIEGIINIINNSGDSSTLNHAE